MALKKFTFTFWFFLIGLIISIQSCNTDFEINSDFVPVPVVFGILDQNDSIHYIKINRSYSGNGNTLQSAAIPDSNYWNTVDAYIYELERIGFTSNYDTLRTWILSDTIISTKDTNGVFFSPDQKVYYFITNNTASGMLQDDMEYHFKAILNEGEKVVTGQTNLVRTINTNYKFKIDNPSSNGSWNFALAGSSVDGAYPSTQAKWTIGNGVLFRVKLFYLYDEYIAGVPTRKEVEWGLGDFICDGCTNSQLSVLVQGEAFYKNIASKVFDDPSVDKRVDQGVRLEITGGSEDLYKYIQVSEPSSSLSQNQPTFTNLNGGFGLLTSRTTISQLKVAYNPGLPSVRGLSKNSLKELCTGQYTATLKFCSAHPADSGEFWFCN